VTKQIKKVLVTGGAGFIGSALIDTLQASGHEIYVIDNLSFGNRMLIKIPDSHFFEFDILDRLKLSKVISEISPDWIIHLAAIHFIPYCNQHPVEAAQVNIQGTINVLEAAKNVKNLEKVFFASTAAVYPACDTAVSETQLPAPTDICRFFNAFGPNETNAHVIPEIQRQISMGDRTIQLGNLEPKRDFIHTSDMAVAIIKLLKTFDNGIEIFNLGRGIEYSVIELVEAFEQKLGEKIIIQVDPARVRKVERMHLLADIAKLKKFIGWDPN
jgi:UDP-glucose 4-epimerase